MRANVDKCRLPALWNRTQTQTNVQKREQTNANRRNIKELQPFTHPFASPHKIAWEIAHCKCMQNPRTHCGKDQAPQLMTGGTLAHQLYLFRSLALWHQVSTRRDDAVSRFILRGALIIARVSHYQVGLRKGTSNRKSGSQAFKGERHYGTDLLCFPGFGTLQPHWNQSSRIWSHKLDAPSRTNLKWLTRGPVCKNVVYLWIQGAFSGKARRDHKKPS